MATVSSVRPSPVALKSRRTSTVVFQLKSLAHATRNASEVTRFEQTDLNLAVSVRPRHACRRPHLAGEAVWKKLRAGPVESFHAS